MRKTQILINKPVYLSLSILDLSKTVMCEFWCDYVKPKYGENAKYGEDTYKDIAEDVKTRFDISNFQLDGPL